MAARLAAEQPRIHDADECARSDAAVGPRARRRCSRTISATTSRREILAEAPNHLNAESPRALFDLSLRLHWALPTTNGRPVFVMGADGDRISVPDDVRATARHHGVTPVIVPGLAHMLMLERNGRWRRKLWNGWLQTLR